jgi:periplasmic protein TonB
VRADSALPISAWSSTLGRREQRLAGAALGLSLAAHLAALGLVPDWRSSAPPAPSTIQVTLLPAPKPAPAPVTTAAPAPVPTLVAAPAPRPAVPPKAAPAPTRPIVAARQDAAPSAPRVSQPTPDPASIAPEASPASAPTAPIPQATAQPSAATVPNAPVDAAAADPALLARYGQALSELLARQQHYPRLAAARGWEGDVVLKLVIARKGQLIGAQVVRSSGHAVLDESALALVAAAQPFPALAGQGSGDDLEVTVPVHYQLNKKS